MGLVPKVMPSEKTTAMVMAKSAGIRLGEEEKARMAKAAK